MDDFAGDEVDIEHVVPVVDVGDTQVDFQSGAFREEELALGIKVETVIRGQTALAFYKERAVCSLSASHGRASSKQGP